MKRVASVSEMQSLAAGHLRAGLQVGLVPTMGFLHEGHLSLMRHARSRCDVLVVSIFVNRMQFGPSEDFSMYPRDLDRDLSLCSGERVDVVFNPPHEEMYADDFSVVVEERCLSQGLCGELRPGHFRGVTTVVSKLFNIVRPDFAVFGQKDAQQALVIQRMVRDLNVPVRIDVAPIVREPDGLAMSSRNTYLSPDERRQALCLGRALHAAEDMVRNGEVRSASVREAMLGIVNAQSSAHVDYIGVVDVEDLSPVDFITGRVLIALAVRIGSTRLIDNTIITPQV